MKDALLKKRLTDRQIDVAYDHLTRTDRNVVGGMLGLATYGGRINTVPSDTTAAVQRESILDLACSTGWTEPQAASENLTWVRAFYRDLFVESGDVLVPSDAYDGALINHPDTDLADPMSNTSGVPWHALYYGRNYACSGSRRGGTRATSFGMRCRFGRNSVTPRRSANGRPSGSGMPRSTLRYRSTTRRHAPGPSD